MTESDDMALATSASHMPQPEDSDSVIVATKLSDTDSPVLEPTASPIIPNGTGTGTTVPVPLELTRVTSQVQSDSPRRVPRYERLYNLSLEQAERREQLLRSIEAADSQESLSSRSLSLRQSGRTPRRPSSAFLAKPRMELWDTRKADTVPGPGAYAGVLSAGPASPVRPSPSFSSSTPRLPEPRSDVPPVGAYEVVTSPSKASAGPRLDSSTPRFPDPKPVAPGPGAYDVPLNEPVSGLASSASFVSRTAAHVVPVNNLKTPNPGSYDVDAFSRVEESRRSLTCGFASSTPRLPSPKSDVPPVGLYDPSPVRESFQTLSFSMGGERFPDPKPVAPGPGTYDILTQETVRAPVPSSAFSSRTKAHVGMPLVRPLDTPGPMAYTLPETISPGSNSRPSSSFLSRAPRLPEPKSSTPPPGSYDVRPPETHRMTVNMSAKTPERFPDPKPRGPLSDYKVQSRAGVSPSQNARTTHNLSSATDLSLESL